MTAGAWALAVAVAAGMLLVPDPVRTPSVLVLAAAQIVLAVRAHRAGGSSTAGRVALLWSVQASLTWTVAGDAGTDSALAFLVVGLVFAGLAEVVLRVAGGLTDPPVDDLSDDVSDDLDGDLPADHDRDPSAGRDRPGAGRGGPFGTSPLPVLDGPEDGRR